MADPSPWRSEPPRRTRSPPALTPPSTTLIAAVSTSALVIAPGGHDGALHCAAAWLERRIGKQRSAEKRIRHGWIFKEVWLGGCWAWEWDWVLQSTAAPAIRHPVHEAAGLADLVSKAAIRSPPTQLPAS